MLYLLKWYHHVIAEHFYWDKKSIIEKETSTLPFLQWLSNIVYWLAVIWYICCIIWFITKHLNFQISLMLGDGPGPIWHQDICSHHHDVYLRAIFMNPNVTYSLLVRVAHIKHAFSITAAWNKCNITDMKYSLFIFLSCNTHLEQHCFTLAYTWTTHSCLNIGKVIGHCYSISFTVLYIQSLMALLTSDTRARNIGKNFIFSITFPVNDIIKPNAFTRIVNIVHSQVFQQII